MNTDYIGNYYSRVKKRKRDAVIEVGDFLKTAKFEDVYKLDLSSYHNNLQSFGLRKVLLDVYPELIIFDCDTYLLIVKTSLEAICLQNKKVKNILNTYIKKRSV